MGYSTTFRLKGELDPMFTPPSCIKYRDEEIFQAKCILLATCMDPFRGFKTQTYDNAYNSIYWAVNIYVHKLYVNWKHNLKETLESNNNQIDFYGWEYAKDDSSIFEDKDAIIKFFTEELFLTSVSPTKGRFEQDNEDYYEKLNSSSQNINDIPDAVIKTMNRLFIDFYREHTELADESDGYEHFFPEEKKENISEQKEIKSEE